MQLLVLLFVIMVVVASANLGVNVSRQQQSKSDVAVIQLANQLMNYFSMNLLFSRVLLNVANGYEFQSSVLMQNRF